MSQDLKAFAILKSKIHNTPIGSYKWHSQANSWYLEIDGNWDSKSIDLLIKAHHSGVSQDFNKYSLSRAPLLSVILRYDNFNVWGKASSISDELLRNPKTLWLLKKRKSKIKLEGKKLIYKAQIKSQELMDIEQLFHNLNGLLYDIDEFCLNPKAN